MVRKVKTARQRQITRLDKLCSEFIRKRAMQRVGGCERGLTPKKDYSQLQCSHFWGRARKSVRYDEDNAIGLCGACHLYLTSHPAEHVEFFKKLLKEKFDLLEGRMRNTEKPDLNLIELYLKSKLEEMG